MDKKTIGIIVKNDYDDILYYDNNFFINIDIGKKDELRSVLEDKLSEVLDSKAFRIDKISKKIPKLTLLYEGNNEENMVMYIVKVYMYSDNSKFLPKEDVLDKLDMSLYEDYYVKYIMRYDKYYRLVSWYLGIFIYLFGTMIILDFPFKIDIKISLFENFWTFMIVLVVIPIIILEKLVLPKIVSHILKYDISDKCFKIVQWIHFIANVMFLFAIITN